MINNETFLIWHSHHFRIQEMVKCSWKLLLTFLCANSWSTNKILNSKIKCTLPWLFHRSSSTSEGHPWVGCCGILTREWRKRTRSRTSSQMPSGMRESMPLEGKTVQEQSFNLWKKSTHFNFAFNLIFKVKVQAQMKTGSKNMFPSAWEQMRN